MKSKAYHITYLGLGDLVRIRCSFSYWADSMTWWCWLFCVSIQSVSSQYTVWQWTFVLLFAVCSHFPMLTRWCLLSSVKNLQLLQQVNVYDHHRSSWPEMNTEPYCHRAMRLNAIVDYGWFTLLLSFYCPNCCWICCSVYQM